MHITVTTLDGILTVKGQGQEEQQKNRAQIMPDYQKMYHSLFNDLTDAHHEAPAGAAENRGDVYKQQGNRSYASSQQN